MTFFDAIMILALPTIIMPCIHDCSIRVYLKFIHYSTKYNNHGGCSIRAY